MINTIWEFLQAVLLILTLLFITAVIVFAFSKFTDSEHRTQLEQRESQYRTACEAVKGRVVWNGKHWECLR